MPPSLRLSVPTTLCSSPYDSRDSRHRDAAPDRAAFHEVAVTMFMRPSDTLLEQHRLTQIGEPVVAIEDRVPTGAGDG